MSTQDQIVDIFIDTQVFRSVDYNFNSRLLHEIRRLAEAGMVNIFTTSVTEQEIRKQLREKAAALASNIRKSLNSPILKCAESDQLVLFRKFPFELLEREALNQFDEFKIKCLVKNIDTRDIKIDVVLGRYFDGLPPFSVKKKNEFPDAIAAECIKQWCQKRRRKMCIVSDDGDWKNVCDEDPFLTHFSDLSAVLSQFPPSDIAVAIYESILHGTGWNCLVDELESLVERLDVETPYIESTPESISISSSQTLDARIIRAADGKAVVEVDFEIELDIELEIDEISPIMISQKDVNKFFVHFPDMLERHKKAIVKIAMPVFVNITYDETDPSLLRIEDCELGQNRVVVNVDDFV